MANKIRLKRSGTSGAQPTPTSLDYGEITLNYADSTIYFRKSDDSLGSITTGTGGGSGSSGAVSLRSATTVSVTSQQSTFTVTGGYTVGAIDVFRNGVKLLPSLDFTATDETSVVLGVAAENGDVVEILAYKVESLVSTIARKVTTVVATSNQTVFTATGGYTVGYVDVYYNGVRLVETTDFTATNGSTITLLDPAIAADIVEVVAHTVHGLADGYTTTQADARFQLATEKGAANGYASLDSSGLVPSTQLPSYVDDVLEYANLAGLPVSGSTGKIYVTIDTGKTYRWSGSAYVEISASPGSTDSVTEGSTNLYYTTARANADFDTRLATKNTNNLTEGTNLYYTDSRARGALSFQAGSGAYDSNTGVVTIPTNNSQLTNGANYITIDSAIAMAIALG